jgi:hypothetical protein
VSIMATTLQAPRRLASCSLSGRLAGLYGLPRSRGSQNKKAARNDPSGLDAWLSCAGSGELAPEVGLTMESHSRLAGYRLLEARLPFYRDLRAVTHHRSYLPEVRIPIHGGQVKRFHGGEVFHILSRRAAGIFVSARSRDKHDCCEKTESSAGKQCDDKPNPDHNIPSIQ